MQTEELYCPQAEGTNYGMPGAAFWDCTKDAVGCLKQGLKVGKGKDQGGLSGNMCGKGGDEEIKGLVVYKQAVGSSVCLSGHALCLITTVSSRLLMKPHLSNDFENDYFSTKPMRRAGNVLLSQLCGNRQTTYTCCTRLAAAPRSPSTRLQGSFRQSPS